MPDPLERNIPNFDTTRLWTTDVVRMRPRLAATDRAIDLDLAGGDSACVLRLRTDSDLGTV